MIALDIILTEAVKAREKVLIFSQSIPTLNFIAKHILENRERRWKDGYDFDRIDGNVTSEDRELISKVHSLIKVFI